MSRKKTIVKDGCFDVDKEMNYYTMYYEGKPNSIKEANRRESSRNRPNIYKIGEHRQLQVEKLDNQGKVIATYISFKEAAQNNNISPACISQAVRGLIPTAAGFKWRRKDVHI